MKNIMGLIEDNIGVSPDVQIQLIKTIIIIIIMAIFYNSLKRILYKVIENTKTYYKTKKIVNYILVLITAMLIGRVWIIGIRSITTLIGLFTAGLAIAMKDLIMNIAGWIFIISRKPFVIGDRVEIEGVSGDVIDIKLFDFTLMEIGGWIKADQSTGRIVSIPNIEIFNNPLFNYNRGLPFVWNEIEVGLTYESNWKKAKKILEEIENKYGEKIHDQAEESIKEASKKFMIFDAKLDSVVYTSANENGIVLTIRYMCYYRNKRDVKQKIWEEILTSFNDQNDVEFSYPTQRLYNRQTENKMKEE